MDKELEVRPVDSLNPNSRVRNQYSIADLFWLIFFCAALFSFLLMRSTNRPTFDASEDAIQLVFGGFGVVVFIGLPFCGALFSKCKSPIVGILVWFAILFLVAIGTNWFLLSLVVLAILVLFVALFQRPLVPRWSLGWRVLTMILFASLLSGHILQFVFPPYRLVQLMAARKEFPIVDLKHRIPIPKNPSLLSSNVEAVGAQFALLDKLEMDYGENDSWRLTELKMFHDRSYERFIRSMGFGMVRMISPSPEQARLPGVVDIPFQANEDYSSKGNEVVGRTYRNLFFGLTAGNHNKEALFVYSYRNFLYPSTFGYVAKHSHAAGFQPHAFITGIPDLKQDQGQFELKRLELISLLKFPEPRVYLLDHLPRMDQLSSDNVETRELNAFEQNGLQQFQTGESLIVSHEPEQIRMVGALRAIKQCTSCHDAKRGDVLGAFSYEFAAKYWPGKKREPRLISDTPFGAGELR
ncbi:MAG: hypothetical protein ABL888_05640 [Pirellulaceae bacterium]